MSRTAPTLELVRDGDGPHPPYLYPDYRSTQLRAPKRPLLLLPHTLSEVT
jgi:protocatechuate 3,4-dioxygenase, beta subunit